MITPEARQKCRCNHISKTKNENGTDHEIDGMIIEAVVAKQAGHHYHYHLSLPPNE